MSLQRRLLVSCATSTSMALALQLLGGLRVPLGLLPISWVPSGTWTRHWASLQSTGSERESDQAKGSWNHLENVPTPEAAASQPRPCHRPREPSPRAGGGGSGRQRVPSSRPPIQPHQHPGGSAAKHPAGGTTAHPKTSQPRVSPSRPRPRRAQELP